MKRKLFFYNHSLSSGEKPPLKRAILKYKNIEPVQKTAQPIKRISDKEGLDIAYKQKNGLYNYGDTLYIAGTKTLNDIIDDLKIPFHATKYSQRYLDAEKYVAHPVSDIKHVVGHSLGGAVSLELQKNYPHLRSTTYAAPTISTPWDTTNSRYRNPTDVVSILDQGATHVSNKITLDPFENHSYHNFNNTSGDSGGWIIGPAKLNSPYIPATSAYTTPPITQEMLKNLNG